MSLTLFYIQVDVYSMGNIFFMLMTRKWPWSKFREKEAKKAIKAGKHPSMPSSIKKSKDPVDKILMKAMKMAHRYDPTERASAREIETFLKEQASEIGTPVT